LKGDPRELLETTADLDRWLVSSGLPRRPNAAAEDVKLARELREAIYRHRVRPGYRAPCARHSMHCALPAAGHGSRLRGNWCAKAMRARCWRRSHGEAVELFGGAERDRIRTCEGDDCALLFLDLSRSGAADGARWPAAATAPRRGRFEAGGGGD
jgi:predicted RNA-binding Zn ribbon-like protein